MVPDKHRKLTHKKRRIRKKWRIQEYLELGFTVAGYMPMELSDYEGGFLDPIIEFVEARNIGLAGGANAAPKDAVLNVEHGVGQVLAMFFFYVTKNDGPHPERQKCRWSSITEEDRLAVIGELERLGALYVSASELKDSHRGY